MPGDGSTGLPERVGHLTLRLSDALNSPRMKFMDPRCYLAVALAVSMAPLLAEDAAAQQPHSATPPVLVVVPLNLVATGPQGGPFSPSSFQYRIRATTDTISYSINAPPWVTADPGTGTLDTSGVTVTLKINPTAQSLPPGTYAPAVKFTNVTNGRGSTSRAIRLLVVPPDPASTAGIAQRAPLLDERGGAILNDRGERLLAR